MFSKLILYLRYFVCFVRPELFYIKFVTHLGSCIVCLVISLKIACVSYTLAITIIDYIIKLFVAFAFGLISC